MRWTPLFNLLQANEIDRFRMAVLRTVRGMELPVYVYGSIKSSYFRAAIVDVSSSGWGWWSIGKITDHDVIKLQIVGISIKIMRDKCDFMHNSWEDRVLCAGKELTYWRNVLISRIYCIDAIGRSYVGRTNMDI